jgi:dinuclear metal center YbgI/SA1388 family protein
MKVGDLVATLERIAPPELAEDWDNTGVLLCPTVPPEITRVLLTIDLTAAVLDEALEKPVELILAYHPPIFSGLKRLTPDDPKSRLVLRCIESRVVIYSPHTALDAAMDGVNDWLLDAFGPGERSFVRPESCQGRVATLATPLSIEAAIERSKQHLGLNGLRLAVASRHAAGAPIERVAVCAGAGGSVLSFASADLLLTGEMRHHDVLAWVESGTSVLLTEHTNSERGYLPRLRSKLQAFYPDTSFYVSERDRDPLIYR